jgi:DNA-binding NtrC family response regulator
MQQIPWGGAASSADTPLDLCRSRAMGEVRQLASRLARGRQPVLITGENGVCKGLVARYVCERSSRAAAPCIPVTIIGAPSAALAVRLFGEWPRQGDPARAAASAFVSAHRGTLILDEIGELPLDLQGRLLRALEEGVPGPDGHPVNVRLIGTTSRDLADLVTAGRFREDLMFRLGASRLHVPPLRDRRQDIRPLAGYLLACQPRHVALDDEAWSALEHYFWPGNFRELSAVIEQVSETALDGRVTLADLPEALRGYGGGLVRPVRERRRHIADDLYTGLVDGRYVFWTDVYEMFMRRDITRADLRGVIERGLVASAGSYRSLLLLFGMPEGDYKRLHNFLASHDCAVDFRPFRHRRAPDATAPPPAAM